MENYTHGSRNILLILVILSTTYLIKTNNTKDEITDWFIAQMNNKNDIGLSVVKYVEHLILAHKIDK